MEIGEKANVITAWEFEGTLVAGKVRDLETKKAKSTLLKGTTSIFGFSVQYVRLKTTTAKESLLKLIASIVEKIPLDDCLHFIGLSMSRFKAWKVRAKNANQVTKEDAKSYIPPNCYQLKSRKLKTTF